MNVPFSPPDISEEEIKGVVDTLQSGWITTGPKTKEFEKRIAAYCGTDGAVCLNSATACMEMTLRLFGIGPGDEVITTAYTYTATASSICHTGAKPVIVDTQKDSLEMDYEKLEQAITPATKAVMPVDVAEYCVIIQKSMRSLRRRKSCTSRQKILIRRHLEEFWFWRLCPWIWSRKRGKEEWPVGRLYFVFFSCGEKSDDS